jgi:hypothetical protein
MCWLTSILIAEMSDHVKFSKVYKLKCRVKEKGLMVEKKHSGFSQPRLKCRKQVPTALFYKGNHSFDLNLSLLHDSCQNIFHVTLTCATRGAQVRLTVTGPEFLLVTFPNPPYPIMKRF